MLDIALVGSAISSLGSAIGVVDKIAGQVQSFFESRRAGHPVPERAPSTVIQAKPDALVVSRGGRPVQTLTRDEIAKRLSPSDLAFVQTLEKSMDYHFALWSKVYPQRNASPDPMARAQTELALTKILQDMRTDLNMLLDFLLKLGVDLDDHYMHIRSLVAQA